MEPVSAGIGLVSEVVRLIDYLRKVKAALETVDQDIDNLIQELNTLQKRYTELEEECEQARQTISSGPERDLWASVQEALDQGRVSLGQLDTEIKKVYGDDPKRQGKIDGLRKQHRLRDASLRIAGHRDQVKTYNASLQFLLNRIFLHKQGSLGRDISKQLDVIRVAVQDLQASTAYSNQVHSADSTAFTVATTIALDAVNASLAADQQQPPNINKHFDTPRSVESCYVGRSQESEALAACFFQNLKQRPHQQHRFVIYGVGGSGKTEFCCKFAQDYQQWFWGVFTIDGRSDDDLQQSLVKNVAVTANTGHNHRAALKWLANQEERWLLIIDNADDPNIELSEYFPKGGRGYVLITTRNPAFQSLGNVGPRSFKFDGMRNDEASALLLKTAGLQSCSDDISRIATAIVEALGYLALGIVLAGKTIGMNFCNIQDYLQYFEKMWNSRRTRKRRSSAAAQEAFEQARERKIEATYDISYTAVAKATSQEAKDALQLLNTLAFLHCENVRFEFMRKCVENPEEEKRQNAAAEEKATAEMHAKKPSKTWKQWTVDMLIRALTASQRDRSPTVLPDILRDGLTDRQLDETRLRKAMQQLTQYSLVAYNARGDSWSMHPLVHRWAQKRLDTSLGEQYLWCEAASTLVSNCIYIGQDDEVLMRHLLPHVDHVRKEHDKLDQQIKDNRMARMKPWPIFEAGFSPRRALIMVKFSLVYAHNGRFQDAEVLQAVVQRFTVKVLGFQDVKTRRLSMALADTLWFLGRCEESAKLQWQVVEACLEHCGPQHRETLTAQHKLGESLWQQGRVAEARDTFEETLAVFKSHYGADDDDALAVMDALGMATVLFGTKEACAKARALHQYTSEVRERIHGPRHLKTLASRELLHAVACWSKERQHLIEAEQGLADIIRLRKDILGPEHGFTLLSMLHCARVKVELEDFEGADELFARGLAVGETNFGKDHMGVLFGRYSLGRMRCREQRWLEARDILLDVAERQKQCLQGWGRYHFDRIGCLVELARAHEALSEYDASEEAVAEALRGFEKVTTQQHPMAMRLREEAKRWKEARPAAPPINPTAP